jgi:hypothetical protein
MKDHGFKAVREQAGEPELLLFLYALIRSQPGLITLHNDYLNVDVVPFLGGRALRIQERRTGAYVTAFNIKQCLFFPFSGGLEDRVGEGALAFGWVEPTLGIKSCTGSLTTYQMTVDGYQVTRTLTLDPRKPVLHVESVLSNPGSTPQTVRLRSHLELNMGDVRDTRVAFTNRGGEKIDKDMSEVIAGLREGEHFYGLAAPNGSWTFTGNKGLRLTQRFENEQIDFSWLYAYPDTLGELEIELWAKRTVLGPGEQMTLRQELEVRPAD